MDPTRAQLQQLLNDIEAEIPSLLRKYPDEAEFWPEFAGLVDGIADAANPADSEWVDDRIEAMLAFHGIRAQITKA